MAQKKLKENSLFIIFQIFWNLVVSMGKSVYLFVNNILGKQTPPIKENRFLDIMNFFFHIGPKSFWKAPSGIKIGRSISTFLHYIFKKEVFTEKRK